MTYSHSGKALTGLIQDLSPGLWAGLPPAGLCACLKPLDRQVNPFLCPACVSANYPQIILEVKKNVNQHRRIERTSRERSRDEIYPEWDGSA